MRVYISVDMEGIAGVSHSAPTDRADRGYPAAVDLEMIDDADRQAEVAHRCALTNAVRAGQHDDDPAGAAPDVAADDVNAPVENPERDDDDRDEPDLHGETVIRADEASGGCRHRAPPDSTQSRR